MGIPTVTRRFGFDAGHRVLGHESKCANLHGHRYTAEVTVGALGLDDLSRVVDFSVVKLLIGNWIDTNWDHTMILHPDDPLVHIMNARCIELPNCTKPGLKQGLGCKQIMGPKDPFIMPEGTNPTAEEMARLLLREAQKLLPSPLDVTHVRLYETPNCWSDATP